MNGVRVTRWARYGKERLYVALADGQPIGYYDVKTGESVLTAPEAGPVFQAAIAEHLGAAGASVAPSLTADGLLAPREPVTDASPTLVPVEPPAAVPAPVEAEWVDLAGNRAGQAAREQADSHLAAMKERSRALTFVARVLDVKTDERAWRVGAQGEESVGARLEKLLEHGWHVLHAVPVGTRGSDIDHVLIGPGGVYTVNTKNHPGKKIWVSPTQIRVDGHRVDYLRNSRFEAERTRKFLRAALGWEPHVMPALVLLTGTLVPDVTIKSGGPDDVQILDRMDVPRVFKKAPQRLAPEGVTEVFEVARRSSTWSG